MFQAASGFYHLFLEQEINILKIADQEVILKIPLCLKRENSWYKAISDNLEISNPS